MCVYMYIVLTSWGANVFVHLCGPVDPYCLAAWQPHLILELFLVQMDLPKSCEIGAAHGLCDDDD